MVANKFSNNYVDDKIIVENNGGKDKNKDYGLAFNFTSNDKKQENSLTVNDNINMSVQKSINDDNMFENKDIIINNALALADKKLKISLQEKWNKIDDYLTDNHFSVIAGKFSDISLEVVGGNYIIFTVMYESMIDGICLNMKLSDEFVNFVFGDKYNYVVITVDEWNKHKEEYINNIKNGKKYELKELILVNKEEKKDKEITVIDKLFDLVGEENIEFK